MLVGRERELGCAFIPPLSIKLARFDATDSARAKPVVDATLHLLTLSVLFIMALCTKPPIPFVGEMGRVGDLRSSQRVGDRSKLWDSGSSDDWPDGSNRCEGDRFNGEEAVLLLCSGGGKETGLSSVVLLRAMPGSCERAAGISARSSSST